MKIAAHTKLGRYEIVSLIGAGGMGEVYLAEDTRLHRKVALKILPENIAADKERLLRFEREAQAACALNHPNIITIHEIGETGDQLFIATEYIEGETLRQKIEKNELDVYESVKISEQIAAALSVSHGAHIIHRDIKPENIMIRRDGYVKILDFGLAKLVEKKPTPLDGEAETRAQVNTKAGMILGTVAYMSPEQARGKDVDERTDVWSLGVCLYEMLTVKQPFTGETTNDTIAAILTKEPYPLDENLPSELQRIVRKTLQKDADKRYQTAKDLLIDLEDVKEELKFQSKLERTTAPNHKESKTQILNAVTTDVAHTTSSAEYVANEIKKHKSVFAVGLIVLLLVSIGTGYWFLSYRTSNTGQIESIAVLPFENASGNAEMDYLSDGVSESVIDRLSQLPKLKVIARSSSFRYRGQNLNLPEIANALGVQAIVTGRVVPRGDSYQIRVEMVDVRDNKQLWGENFNRKASDVQILQADISREIAENLSLRLSGAQTQQFAKEGTTNPIAYEALVKGRFFLNKVGQDNLKKATEHFEQAVTADPNYALAYSYLSSAYGSGGKGDLSIEERRVKAREVAMKAVELAPNLAEAHFAMAQTNFQRWEWAEHEHELKRAIELNPNLVKARSRYAAYLYIMGRNDEAIAEANRSIELNPLDFFAAATVANAYRHARRNDEAVEAAKRALELEPNFSFTHSVLADTYAAKGMYREAIAEYQEAIRLRGGNSPDNESLLGATYVKIGERAKGEEILANLKSRANTFRSTPLGLAVLYDALGMRNEAFAVLENGFAEHHGELVYMRLNPNYDSMRSDPRFQDLLRRMGLPQ
jgi:serine/threonine-protein kinase